VAALTLLLPELRRIDVPDTSPLARWLARGDELSKTQAGRDVALRECFEFLGTAFPHAALSRSLESSDARDASWLYADPAYVIADAVTVRMLACGALGLTEEESHELAKPLKLLFGDAGFPLETSASGRWFLRCPSGSPLPSFAPPSQVLGDDLARHLPSGENERQWRHLLNEAQVILHNHPINEHRAREGKAPANSLWFWGAGSLPEWVRTPFSHLASRSEDAIALAKLAKVSIDISLDTATIKSTDNVLFDAAELSAELRETALLKIDEALRAKRLSRVEIKSADGSRYRYDYSHRWRFWRPIRSINAQ
jgi:hypothetical protein